MNPYLATVIVLALALPAAVAEDARGKDVILADKRKIHAIVYHEKLDGIEYKTSEVLPTMQTMRWSDIRGIVYHGMEGNSYFATGKRDMQAGQFEMAAQRFASLAAGADKREWEQAYGSYYEGVAWERAGAYDKAAAAFGRLVESLPEHRFVADAAYRQGINLARAGEAEAAVAVADFLEQYAKDTRERSATQRANAIRTAIAALRGDIDEAQSLSRKVTLSSRDGETYLHWGQFWADFLMQRERYADAASTYGRLLENAEVDPVDTATLSLGYGIALAKDNNRDRALTALMRLDALPYGSPEQRLEARYWIGRLMWELAQERRESDRDRVAAFAEASIVEARRMLESVAQSTLTSAVKSEAERLLEVIPGGEPAEEAVEGEAAAEGAEAAAPAR